MITASNADPDTLRWVAEQLREIGDKFHQRSDGSPVADFTRDMLHRAAVVFSEQAKVIDQSRAGTGVFGN